jgi:uncharacterized membrane protein
MEKFAAIFMDLGFWKITVPILIGVLAWYLNERAKRKWDAYSGDGEQ